MNLKDPADRSSLVRFLRDTSALNLKAAQLLEQGHTDDAMLIIAQSLETIGRAKEFVLPKSSQAQEAATPTTSTTLSPDLKKFLGTLREVIAQKDLALGLALLRSMNLSEEEHLAIAAAAALVDCGRSVVDDTKALCEEMGRVVDRRLTETDHTALLDELARLLEIPLTLAPASFRFAKHDAEDTIGRIEGCESATVLPPAEILHRLLQEAVRVIKVGKFSAGFSDPAQSVLQQIVDALDQETEGASDVQPILRIARQVPDSMAPAAELSESRQELIEIATDFLMVLQGNPESSVQFEDLDPERLGLVRVGMRLLLKRNSGS